MGNLYLMRHGQTTCNADQVIQGPRIDSELSETGHRQASALGDAFAQTHLDAVYVSPMKRARQTAQAVVDERPAGIPARVVPELYELDYGGFCGRRIPDVQDEIHQILDAWSMGFIDQAFPGGESPVLAQHRVRTFVEGVLQSARSNDVAVVAHGRINRILLATMTGTPLQHLDRFPQDNANINHLEVSVDGVQVRRLNDTAHLDDIARSFS